MLFSGFTVEPPSKGFYIKKGIYPLNGIDALFSAANLLVHIPQDDVQHLPGGHDIGFFWEVADVAGDKVRIL